SSVIPSQPSHLASSSFVQSEASCCQRRLTFPEARQSLRFFFTAASRSAGRDALCAFTLGVLERLVFFSTSASRVSKASAKSFTPSAVSLSVDRKSVV